VSEDEYLLNKVDIKVEDKQIKGSDLKPYLRQEPNFKIFGLLKWPLYVYNWSGKNDNNWLNKQLRRIGEPPEIMDTLLIDQSKTQIERYMINKGYLHAQVTSAVDTSKRKKATVTYFITPNEPHRINDYRTLIDDPEINRIIHLKPPDIPWHKLLFRSVNDEYASLVKEGSLFDRDILDKERQRIATLLRQHGYYAFNRDYLYFLADSTKQHSVNLTMLVKPVQIVENEGPAEEIPHRPYYMNQVRVVTDYDPLNTEQQFHPVDSVLAGDLWIYYGEKSKSIRPEVLKRRSYFKSGKLYNEWDSQQTYSAFSALHALRHVNIKYQEFEEHDTLKLNCTVFTAPAKTQGFGIDMEGTNSDGDLGFATGLNYLHRNLFKGSELFSAKIRGAYESLSANKESGLGNYWEFAGETSILFPTFMLPFTSENFRRRIRATTEFRLSYNHQRRPEYQRAIMSGGWSYIWQDRKNSLAKHTFKLLDVNYVYLPHIDQEFKDSLPVNIALYNYSNQFIASSGYVYSFNNYDPLKRGKNTYSLRLGIELAGNILYGLSNLFHAKKDENGRYKLFGINYSQYIKGDIDFARSLIIDERNSVAFHIGGGVGFPYGNRKEMPFERTYFSGGANSNRGWSVRSLGPGSMPLDKNTTFVNQVGDIRFDVNLEYRSKLFWRFEIASFVDAGNIWTIRSYDHQPKGNFNFTRFYKEIAVSYGLGLRLDFDYFLLRFDTGLKAYNPQEKGSRKLAIVRPDLHENFAWHFAVGYPF
jgi:outer membrane protein assembly factor BamA